MVKNKKIILFDIDYTLFDTDPLRLDPTAYTVYEEIHETLTQMQDIGALGIFSEGELAYQQKKLTETAIEKYFLTEHVHIVESKDETIEGILKKYKKADMLFLVDDKLTILRTAKKYMPRLISIWIKRGKYAMKQEPISGFTPDLTVTNLKEIIPFILSKDIS